MNFEPTFFHLLKDANNCREYRSAFANAGFHRKWSMRTTGNAITGKREEVEGKPGYSGELRVIGGL